MENRLDLFHLQFVKIDSRKMNLMTCGEYKAKIETGMSTTQQKQDDAASGYRWIQDIDGKLNNTPRYRLSVQDGDVSHTPVRRVGHLKD